MSTLYAIRSICGKSVSHLDSYDLTHNNGVVCCGECESILICRKAWGFLYQKGSN